MPGDAASDLTPAPAEAPVTRVEFERLIAIVREILDELQGHSHGYSSPGSTYGESTYGPDCWDALRGIGRRLDALLDTQPKPTEDDDDD